MPISLHYLKVNGIRLHYASTGDGPGAAHLVIRSCPVQVVGYPETDPYPGHVDGCAIYMADVVGCGR